MRLDVREATIRCAADELRENGCYIILASKVVIDEIRDDWSRTVQLMASTEGGIAELTIRDVSHGLRHKQAANGEDSSPDGERGA